MESARIEVVLYVEFVLLQVPAIFCLLLLVSRTHAAWFVNEQTKKTSWDPPALMAPSGSDGAGGVGGGGDATPRM